MGRPKGIPLSPEHKAKLMAAARQGRLGKPMLAIYSLKCGLCDVLMLAKVKNKKWCFTCAPSSTWKSRASRYGISKPMWDQMLSDQDGHCVLCPATKKLVVDHCHQTNRVRGLLCYGCNIALNRVDTPGWTKQAVEYVRNA